MEHDNQNWTAGTTLSCDCGTYWHYGIANGEGGVIHNSKSRGMVVHETEQEFSDGRKVERSDTITSQDLSAAYDLALANIGKPYRLFCGNCEHFVRMAHGMPIESRQVGRHVFSTGAIAISLITGAHPVLRAVSFALGFIGLWDKKKDK